AVFELAIDSMDDEVGWAGVNPTSPLAFQIRHATDLLHFDPAGLSVAHGEACLLKLLLDVLRRCGFSCHKWFPPVFLDRMIIIKRLALFRIGFAELRSAVRRSRNQRVS